MKVSVPFYYEKKGRIEVDIDSLDDVSIQKAIQKVKNIFDQMSVQECEKLSEYVDSSDQLEIECLTIYDDEDNIIEYEV